MERLSTIFYIIISIVTLKAIIIGSDFNFCDFIKYGKIYSKWYFDRETFKDYLKSNDI